MKLRRNKINEKSNKQLLKKLPYFGFRGDLKSCHGLNNTSDFNNTSQQQQQQQQYSTCNQLAERVYTKVRTVKP